MSQLLTLMRTRRTIRRFLPTPVPLDLLREIAEAGALAPSAANAQPWRLHIVQTPALVREVSGAVTWYEGPPPAEQEPVAYIVVTMQTPPRWSYNAWPMLASAAAAMENMVLLAWEFGLGSCWLGTCQRDTLQRLLGLSADTYLFSLLALGYPAESPRLIDGEGDVVKRSGAGQLTVMRRPPAALIREL